MGQWCVRELTLEGPRRKRKPKKRKKRKSENPFIMDVESLRDLREEVVDMEKDALLFISAPYCRNGDKH